MILSNGKEQTPIVIKKCCLKSAPKYAELIFHQDKKKYYLHIIVEVKERKIENTAEVMAIDLGIIHPMVCFDGKKVLIYNGGILNSKIRYRNKKLAEFQQKLSKCQKNSRKFKKLLRAKKRVLRRVNNQIRDVLEKYTSHLIGYCIKNGIGTIVLGNLRGIRNRARYKKVSNQKIHQWMFKRIARRIEEKAKFVGIEVKFIKENETSQNCLVCGSKNKSKNRNYECKSCDFRYHRDGVGAINMYKKYTGSLNLVVGLLACPTGVRYTSHLCCPIEWNIHPIGKTAENSSCQESSPFQGGESQY